MATYSTIRKGSRGDDVTNLQKMLNQNGYNLSEDGVFGSRTASAVRDYQSKNGLSADGIVGSNTWGKLTGGTSATTPKAPTDVAKMNTAQRLSYYETAKPNYDTTYSDALKAHLQGGVPKNDISNLPYTEQIAALTEEIANRQPFNYDYSSDPLYRQYAQQYQRNANLAMQDTMANAAALTGGYGSSSAHAVGNQAYNNQMAGLNDALRDLANAAYERYLNEGNEKRTNLDMYRGLQNEAYNRNRDDLNDWYNQADLYRGLDSDAYNRSRDEQSDYFNWLNYYYGKNQDELAMALAASRGRGGRGPGKTNDTGRQWTLTDSQNAVKNAIYAYVGGNTGVDLGKAYNDEVANVKAMYENKGYSTTAAQEKAEKKINEVWNAASKGTGIEKKSKKK